MSESQRGEKRNCPGCGARFYDLARTPIVCPGCGSEFSADDFLRPRRRREPEPSPAESEKSVPDEKSAEGGGAGKAADKPGLAEDGDAVEGSGEADAEDIKDDEEDEPIIEDASELGEDEDDMAEVIVNVVVPEKTEER